MISIREQAMLDLLADWHTNKSKYNTRQIAAGLLWNDLFYLNTRGSRDVWMERRVGSIIMACEARGDRANNSLIARELGVSRFKLRKMLDAWEASGNFNRVREGRHVYIELSAKRTETAISRSEAMIDTILKCADDIRALASS